MNKNILELEKLSKFITELPSLKDSKEKNEIVFKEMIEKIIKIYENIINNYEENTPEALKLNHIINDFEKNNPILNSLIEDLKLRKIIIYKKKNLEKNINILIDVNDLNKYLEDNKEEFEMLIDQIISNYLFIKNNCKKDNIFLLESKRELKKLVYKHHELYYLEKLLNSNVNLTAEKNYEIEKLESAIRSTLNTIDLLTLNNKNKLEHYKKTIENLKKELELKKHLFTTKRYNELLNLLNEKEKYIKYKISK